MRIRIVYFLEEAFSSFKHNRVINLTAVIVVLFSLLLVGSFLLTNHIIGKVAAGIEDKVELEVFIKDGSPQEEIYSIERKIKALKEVDSVEFITKKEALKTFINRNKDNKALITEIVGNPLPASYRVFLKNPRAVESVAEKVNHFPEKQTSIDEVRFGGKQFIRRLFSATKWVRLVMLIFIILLCFVSLALISMTIRLAIHARRKEIGVMRLVGASNWFIRWPFLLEGILQGLAGAILAISILALIRVSLFDQLQTQNSWLATLQVDPNFYKNLMLLLVIAGVVIGAAGSTIALRRHLKI